MGRGKSNVPKLVHSDGEFRKGNLEIRRKHYDMVSLLHWHDYYELEYIYSGEVIYQYNGTEYKLSQGCAYMVTPSDYHKIVGKDAVLYNIAFNDAQVSKKLLEKLLACSGATIVHFDENDTKRADYLLDALLCEYEKEDELREYAISIIWECFLLLFVRGLEAVAPEQKKYSSAVMQTVAYVKLHFKSKISLTAAADEVHLTPNYLGELFKAEIGTSFSAYLMQTRLNYAQNLLRRGTYTVEEAALASGFSSQTYFSDSFKKQYGYPPARVKRMLAESGEIT